MTIYLSKKTIFTSADEELQRSKFIGFGTTLQYSKVFPSPSSYLVLLQYSRLVLTPNAFGTL